MGSKTQNSNTVVYLKLFDSLKQAILSKELAPGSLIDSEWELAKHYQISRSSVRIALDKLKSEGLLLKKPGKGTYVKNWMLDNEPYQERMFNIALDFETAPGGVDGYYSQIFDGIKNACHQSGCVLSLCDTKRLSYLKPNFLDGLILMDLAVGNQFLFEELHTGGVELIAFNRISDSENIAYVSVDFRNSAKQSVDFLKHKGHERIAILTPPPSPGNIASHLRYKGYCDAMNVTGLEIDNPLYWQVPGGQSDSYYTEMIINYFTASRATAVWVCGGSLALPLFEACLKLELKIPEHLEIMVSDDMSHLYEAWKYPFYYLKSPLAEMGKDCVEYLTERLKNRKATPVKKAIYQAEIMVCDKDSGIKQ